MMIKPKSVYPLKVVTDSSLYDSITPSANALIEHIYEHGVGGKHEQELLLMIARAAEASVINALAERAGKMPALPVAEFWGGRQGCQGYSEKQLRQFATEYAAGLLVHVVSICNRLYKAPLNPEDPTYVEAWQDALDIAEQWITVLDPIEKE